MRCALDGEHGHPRCRLLFGEIIGEHRVKFVFVDEAFVAKIARHGTLQACSWQVLFCGKIKGEKLAFSVKYLALVLAFLSRVASHKTQQAACKYTECTCIQLVGRGWWLKPAPVWSKLVRCLWRSLRAVGGRSVLHYPALCG